MNDARTYTARELSGTGVWPPTLVVRRDNPCGPTGKVYAIYGDDDLTATRVKVAWGDAADLNPIYVGDHGRDEDTADLIPAVSLLHWTPETDDEPAQPATVFDTVVVEYAANPGGIHIGAVDPAPETIARAWEVDRRKPWLLVEDGTRGGHWVTSHISLHKALQHHQIQEHRDAWAIAEVVHHPTGIRIAGNGHELAIPSNINRDPVIGYVWVGGGRIKAYTGTAYDGHATCLGESETREHAHQRLIFHAIDLFTRAERIADYGWHDAVSAVRNPGRPATMTTPDDQHHGPGPAGTRAATAARTRQLLDTYPGDPGIAESAEAAPWLLVEDNTHPAGDASRWISGHATAAEAVAYHRDQESAEGWTVVELVDVDADRHWPADTHPAWHPDTLPDVPRTERGAVDYPALLDQLVEAAGRGNSDQTAHLLHQALLTYSEAVTTAEETTQALACAESAPAARDLYTLLAQPAPPNFPGPLVDLSAVGTNKLVPIPAVPAVPAAGRLRDLIEQAQAALTYADGERYAALVEEIVARYAAHETDPGPSRDQLTDMLDAVDDEEGPARIGERDYPAGWHDAVDAVRNLIDRYPDGLRTPHPDAGQPFRGPDGKIMDGFVVAICGHRVAGMEWRAGMTTCERDSEDEFRQPAAAGA